MTETLLASELAERLELVHVDISDHRPISTVERLDLVNVLLAARHGVAFLVRLLASRPALVYLPIARKRLGFLRDYLFLLPARLARVPTVVHLHSRSFSDYWRSETRWMRLLIGTAFGPRSHGIVLAESIRDGFGPLLPPERVHVVANGIRDPGIGPPANSRAPLVLHISTLTSDKGLFDVLEVARRLHAERPDVRFVVAGDWYTERERERALATVAELGLTGCLSFPGHVEGAEKSELLQSAAVMLFPSKYEGQPLVVLEAMAAGTPVVATDVGAVAETARNGVEAFVVPVGDLDALTEQTLRLLDDVELRGQLGAAARRRYEELHTPSLFAAKLADVLEAVIAESAEHGRR